MKMAVGSGIFNDVQIPVLWGERAILQDRKGRISVIDLSGVTPRLEILANDPAPNVDYLPFEDGFKILRGQSALYAFYPDEKRFESIELQLLDITVDESEVRVGNTTMSRFVVVGSPVGIFVNENGFGIGGTVPPNLARLILE